MKIWKRFRKGACCPFCHTAAQLLLQHEDFAGVAIYWCGACQYGFCSPMPSKSYLRHYYDSRYRTPENFNDAVMHSRLVRAEAQWRFITEALGEIPKSIKLLDVGCGIGAFVAHVESLGYAAYGIDDDSRAISWGREHLTDSLGPKVPSNFHLPQLIVLSHVIEHFTNLSKALRSWRKARYIFFEVPHAPQEIILSTPPVSHLHFFTPNSIKKLCATVGLRLIRLNTYGMTLEEVLSGTRDRPKHEYFAVSRPQGNGNIIRGLAEWF